MQGGFFSYNQPKLPGRKRPSSGVFSGSQPGARFARRPLVYMILDGLFGIIPLAFILFGWAKVSYPSHREPEPLPQDIFGQIMAAANRA